MPDRDALIDGFLRRAGWDDARRRPLAGDASHRRYLRLARDTGDTAVLMDAGPDAVEEVRSFVSIARHLSGIGLSAPALLAEDVAAGLLLLEDLGDGLFARLAIDPAAEAPLYRAAAEALAALHRAPPPGDLVRFTPDHMADLARLVFDWYAPATPAAAADGIVHRLRDALTMTAPVPTVLSLRDFHAENLLWLPDRTGPARVGLLDFQDAVIAHPAYDLVSLLADARRDVGEATRAATFRHFLDLTGHDAAPFMAAAAALSVQRNLRILGVFARLAGRDGKPGYLRFLPRVWGHLARDLEHAALRDLRDAALCVLPPPDALMREAQCPAP
jgi:aminoglycoside/choline kinase family phosphotransferase